MALPGTLLGQGGVPTLTFGPPRFTTGDLELHQVSGAGLLPDGRIAIANGGTFNVIIVNRNGTIDKRFGREGSGPGDFGGLDRLTTFGDTVVTWDGMLRRVTLWRPEGTVIRSYSTTATDARSALSLEAIISPSGYLATVRSYPKQQTNGVYLNTAELFSLRGTTRTALGHHPWAYTYFYAEGNGSASFAAPFLGESLVAWASGKTLLLLLGESRIGFVRPDGTHGGVTLPIVPVAGRERAQAYGDSTIAAQRDPDPSWERRFRAMFGPTFPIVDRQAVAQRAVTVGDRVWFQEFQKPQQARTTWWIVDARRETLVGRITLPASARVLGGDDRQVLIRMVDEDGVQSVALFDYPTR
jgi:hypothetical protein